MKDLAIRITGAIESSNFDEYKDEMLLQIKRANRDLVTDEDFIEAAVVVKACKEGEDNIKEARHQAIASMEDVNRLYKAMDEISEQLRETRLNLGKKIKTEKENRRNELLDHEVDMIDDFVESIDFPQFRMLVRDIVTEIQKDLSDSMSGRSSLKSIKTHLQETTTAAMEGLTKTLEKIRNNDAMLTELSDGNLSLFPDRMALLLRDSTALQEIIVARVDRLKAEEETKRLNEENNERKRREFEEAKKANDAAEANKSIGENMVPESDFGETPLQKAQEKFEIAVMVRGEIEDAQEAARMIKRLFKGDKSIFNITLNRGK